jgi:hypothetical protein
MTSLAVEHTTVLKLERVSGDSAFFADASERRPRTIKQSGRSIKRQSTVPPAMQRSAVQCRRLPPPHGDGKIPRTCVP